jgi:hypothetical protein
MDLCTVTNGKYIKNALNLINSYRLNSYGSKVFLYYFDLEHDSVEKLKKLEKNNITVREVPFNCNHAYESTVFYYKTFAIKDALPDSDGIIYSDATNTFVRKDNLRESLVDDALFLPYNDPRLINNYWTTDLCFEKMQAESARNMMQYWAGFQAYGKSEKNLQFVNEMHDYMLDPDIALPNTSIKNPDGSNRPCREHRQDQSVYSLLIHKHFRHNFYDPVLQSKYGDWQTFRVHDDTYRANENAMVMSSRESKHGQMRFLDE